MEVNLQIVVNLKNQMMNAVEWWKIGSSTNYVMMDWG